VAGPSYIIDGYNLLHKVPVLAVRSGREPEAARERLVGLIASWKAGRGVGVLVVFDGPRTASAPRPIAGVRVVFAKDADAYIKRLVSGHAHPRSLQVVSSDGSVVRHARDLEAKTIGSEEFARLLAPPAGSAPRSEPRELDRAEVADWEEWFRSKRREEFNVWIPPDRKRRRRH
jgi:predicted RNA-binding protein with PIN domain